MKWIRHGDVILQQVESVKGKQKKVNECILAEGEVTGHFHKLSGQILESQFEDERFIEVIADSELTHQEHDTLLIPKGKYKVIIQREVDLLGEVRQVMD
jgi:hypothetical protein